MQLEDYFEFEKFQTKFGEVERIRIKGHRIAIEHVIEVFNAGMPAETIARERFPTLKLEEVFATLVYYLANKDQVDAYIKRGEQIGEAFYQEYLQKEPDEVTNRLRALKAERQMKEQDADGESTLPVR